MDIVISSGHGKYVRGASGYLDEVDEARRVVEQVATYLREMGVGVKTFHDNTSHDVNTNLSTIVAYHNKQSRDLDVSVHFNAYQTTSNPMGTECLYVNSNYQAQAGKVSSAVAVACSLPNRGAKYRSDLYFLNNTHEPALLIETCFVDSSTDATHYNNDFNNVCIAIAESLSGEAYEETEPPDGTEPPEPEPPSEPAVGTVHGIAAGDQLNIRASSSSSSPVIGRADNNDLVTVIAETYNGDTRWYQLKFGDDHMAGVAVYGWASAAYIRVDGNIPDAEEQWRTGITATEFGGGGDEQDSAYPDIDYITGTTKGVALPYKWKETPRPRVTVKGPGGEITTDIVDLGPWNTNDPSYVLDGERPLVEGQYEDGTEAQNGQVPTNDAAIDLTPPVADAVGISGKGKVQWRFA